MAYTIEDYNILKKKYDELRDIRWTGAAKVKYSDKEIEYISTDKMKGILDEMEDELGLNEKKRRTRVACYGRGY